MVSTASLFAFLKKNKLTYSFCIVLFLGLGFQLWYSVVPALRDSSCIVALSLASARSVRPNLHVGFSGAHHRASVLLQLAPSPSGDCFPGVGCLRPAGRHPAGRNLFFSDLSRSPELIPTSMSQITFTTHSYTTLTLSLAGSVPSFRSRGLLGRPLVRFTLHAEGGAPALPLYFVCLHFGLSG